MLRPYVLLAQKKYCIEMCDDVNAFLTRRPRPSTNLDRFQVDARFRGPNEEIASNRKRDSAAFA